jgi:predicted ATP-dependent endonuclease of OLD family
MIVVEGQTDASVLRRLIRPELLSRVQFKAAGGASGLTSFARSAFALHRGPVVLVADADTTNERAVRVMRREKQELLELASGGLPCAVVLAVPELETVFFDTTHVLDTLLEHPPTSEQRVRARFEPKKVLTEILAAEPEVKSVDALVASLTGEQAKHLQNHPIGRELNDFVSRVTTGQLQPA